MKSHLVSWFKWDEAGVAIALLSLTLIFTILAPEFLTLRTWGSIATFASVLGIIALGSCLLMTAGEFDLSVGSVCALTGMLFAMGTVQGGQSTWLMAAITLSLGAVLGLLNGWITLTTQIPSFITTLGTMLIWRGVVLAVSGGFPVSLVSEREGALALLGSPLGHGFSTGVFVWLALALGFTWMLKLTSFGNQLLATGGNPNAARSMGVPTTRIKLLTFSLSGFLAALAGIVLFAQLQDLAPTAGENYELFGIAAAVIGGTALTGGVGSVIGAVLGTLLMGVIQAGLVHVGIDSYWFRSFVGLLLVLSVMLNLWLKRTGKAVA